MRIDKDMSSNVWDHFQTASPPEHGKVNLS